MPTIDGASTTGPGVEPEGLPRETFAEATERLRPMLEREVLELLAGRLPGYLEARLARFGDVSHPIPPYALGVNQSALYSRDDVSQFFDSGGIRQNGGFGGHIEAPSKRFLVIEDLGVVVGRVPASVEAGEYRRLAQGRTLQSLAIGYTGDPNNYRLVHVFPLLGEDKGDTVRTPARVINEPYGYGQNDDGTPDGAIYVTRYNDDGAVKGIYNNSMFCAGIIDDEGRFTPNASFGLEDAFTPSTAETLRSA